MRDPEAVGRNATCTVQLAAGAMVAPEQASEVTSQSAGWVPAIRTEATCSGASPEFTTPIDEELLVEPT